MTQKMTEVWANASPTVAFPFSGRSYKEMKELLSNDCHSTTLHTATSHFAPAANQNHFLMERYIKEYNLSSPRKVKAQEELTSSNRGLALPRLSPRTMDQSSLNGTQTLDSVRQSPRRAHDMELLKQLGRKEYLHVKRLEPAAQDELVSVFNQTSRVIGEQIYAGESPFLPLRPPQEDFRRQGGGMKSSFRTRGVFS